MAEKFVDLFHVIGDALDVERMWEERLQFALRWLDEHPDQVPGRTITERVKITDTEAYELYESARSFSLDDFKLALESVDGIETVDDPEPTNAEKLVDAINAIIDGQNRGILIGRDVEVSEFAASLDEAGVKAPGGV